MHEGTPDCKRDPSNCNMRDSKFRCLIRRGGGKCPVQIELDKVKRIEKSQGQLKLKFKEA